jgi:hypothetical protein
MESGSLISGNQSALPTSDHDHASSDHRSLDVSVSTHSVEANPSETAREEVTPILPDHSEINDGDVALIESVQQPLLRETDGVARLPDNNRIATVAGGEGGLHGELNPVSLDDSIMSPGVHQAASILVDGFAFIKDDPFSPPPVVHTNYGLSTHDWSPEGEMHISPLQQRRPQASEYGAITADTGRPLLPPIYMKEEPGIRRGESEPLLSDIPPEIITRRSHSASPHVTTKVLSVRSVLDSVFSDVRSDEDSTKEAELNESEQYAASNMLARGQLIVKGFIIMETPYPTHSLTLFANPQKPCRSVLSPSL